MDLAAVRYLSHDICFCTGQIPPIPPKIVFLFWQPKQNTGRNPKGQRAQFKAVKWKMEVEIRTKQTFGLSWN